MVILNSTSEILFVAFRNFHITLARKVGAERRTLMGVILEKKHVTWNNFSGKKIQEICLYHVFCVAFDPIRGVYLLQGEYKEVIVTAETKGRRCPVCLYRGIRQKPLMDT